MDPRVAKLLAAHLYGMALVAGWLVSWWGLALVAAALPVMEGYERWGKARGLPGNVAIGLLTFAAGRGQCGAVLSLQFVRLKLELCASRLRHRLT